MDGRHGTGRLKLVVAHPQTLLRQVMVRLLQDVPAFGPIVEAGTSEQLRGAATTCEPAVVLLDESLSAEKTPHLIAEITRAHPEIVVIVVADDVTEESVAQLRTAGAAAVALKTLSFAALADTIRRATAPGRLAQPGLSA